MSLAANEDAFWAKYLHPDTTSKLQKRSQSLKLDPRDDAPQNGCSDNLPVELLYKIFERCITPEPSWYYLDNVAGTHLKLLALAKTCRRWRAVISSHSPFWSNIHAYEPKPTYLPLIELWLIRSGTSLLHVGLWTGGPLNSVAYEIMGLYATQAHRWSHVSFHFTGETPCDALCTLPKGAAQNLQSAVLAAWKWPEGSQKRAWDALASPSLREVTFQPHDVQDIPENLVPWQRLTSISMPRQLSYTSLFGALSHCHNLLKVRVFSPTGSLPSRHSPVVLPHLKILYISFRHYPSLELFQHLSTPALETLDIRSHGAIPSAHIDYLDMFLLRSGCQPRLSVDSLEKPTEEFSRALEALSLRRACVIVSAMP